MYRPKPEYSIVQFGIHARPIRNLCPSNREFPCPLTHHPATGSRDFIPPPKPLRAIATHENPRPAQECPAPVARPASDAPTSKDEQVRGSGRCGRFPRADRSPPEVNALDPAGHETNHGPAEESGALR